MSEELLMIPGPTPVVGEVLEALSQDTLSHVDPRFVAKYREALDYTRKLFNCDGEAFILCGSGTLAMEMAVVNTVAPGENLLVLSQGFFGDRFIALAESFGINVDAVKAPWGKRVSLTEVREKLAGKRYKAVTITHVDTSTGVEADLVSLIPVIKKASSLVILDGVCASAGIAEDMSFDYGNGAKIDLVLTGSQKAIGVPPGLAVLAFGRQALKAREELEKVRAYYADIYNWLPVMRDPGKYYATPAVNMVFSYLKAMEIIFAEGLENRYQRHRKYGKAVRSALATFGMKPVASEEDAAATMSCIRYPEGVEDVPFRKACFDRKLVLAGALGEFKGKAFRIGHMGNTTPKQLERTVKIIGEVLQEQGLDVNTEEAVLLLRHNLG